MSTAAHVEHPTSDFPEYLRILRTRKWSVIIVLVLLVGAAYAYSARQTPIYQGTARVLVLPMSNPVSGGNQTRNNPIDMPTEQQVATGEPVATLVQKDLHITTPISTLLKHLKVTVVMNTDVLNFAYQDPSKTTAATVANGFAKAYVEQRSAQALALVRETMDDRIRTREELERRLGAPVLAAVPKQRGWRKADEAQLIMRSDPKNPVSESYRTLGTNVQYLASRQNLKVLMITSAV